MTKYPYPIVSPEHMLPPEEIELVPEEDLHPIVREELGHLRRGIPRICVYGDSPEARRSVATHAIYYQQVAHKEGWRFDPNNFQVTFTDQVPVSHRTHVYSYDEPREDLSSGNRAGYVVSERTGLCQRLNHEITDHLADIVEIEFRQK